MGAPWLASSAPSCSSPPLLPLFHSLKTLLLPQQQLQQQHLQLQLQQQLLAPVLLLQQLQHLQQLLQRQQQQQLLPQEGRDKQQRHLQPQWQSSIQLLPQLQQHQQILHLSTCSDGSSCVCIFGVSTFQGFHSFLLNCFINKQTRDLCTMQWLPRHYQSYLFQQHFFAAVLCFPSSFKDQESRIKM